MTTTGDSRKRQVRAKPVATETTGRSPGVKKVAETKGTSARADTSRRPRSKCR